MLERSGGDGGECHWSVEEGREEYMLGEYIPCAYIMYHSQPLMPGYTYAGFEEYHLCMYELYKIAIEERLNIHRKGTTAPTVQSHLQQAASPQHETQPG